MKIFLTYAFELKPTNEQRRRLGHFAYCARLVYNQGQALLSEAAQNGDRFLRYFDFCRLVTKWRRSTELHDLREAPAQILQQAMKNLDFALQAFLDGRAEFPRRKARTAEAFRFASYFKIDEENSRVWIQKLGWVRYRQSRPIDGNPRQLTVKREGTKWRIAVVTEHEIGTPVHPSQTSAGIDAGITRLATLSDGTIYEPLNSLKKNEEHLKNAQRALARKEKFGKNWEKQRRRIQNIHRRIVHARQDYLHKISTRISAQHAIVVIEDLQVRQMSKCAAGTNALPGRNVRAKSALNKSILDQGWAELRKQLTYKEQRRGGRVIAIPPQNTSVTCSKCGHAARSNRLSQALFKCGRCGWTDNADLNAAKNILAAGHAVMACEANGAVMPSAAGTFRSGYKPRQGCHLAL